MTQKFKILVTRKWPKKVEESLVTTFDTTLNVEDKPLSESELIEAMKSYDALLPTVTDPITDKIISTPDEVENWYHENKLEQIVVAYAATGPNASFIRNLNKRGLNVVQISKEYDQIAWPHATHGFFRFKEKIPALINELGLMS